MKKLPFLLCFVLLLCSCNESDEVNEYNDWPDRNAHYLDSIATLARNGVDGWTMYKAYTLGDEYDDLSGPRKYYVYAKSLEQGEGTYSPLYKDSVRVHYTGHLIPTATYPQGYNFDRSFNGTTLNEDIDVPTLMTPSALVTGFSTALMHMVQGDRWQVVIPPYLGYGTGGSGSIPANSVLIFDIKLARVYRYGIDTDTSWH